MHTARLLQFRTSMEDNRLPTCQYRISPDYVLVHQTERLLDGANVHEWRSLLCRYLAECWVGKHPELINALHDELTAKVAAETRVRN